MKGYFVKKGDLIIPGILFYKGVANGQIDLSSFKTTPFFWQTYNQKAINHLKEGEYNEAKKVLDEILSEDLILSSKRWELLYNRGVAAQALGNQKEAQDFFQSAYDSADEAGRQIIIKNMNMSEK